MDGEMTCWTADGNRRGRRKLFNNLTDSQAESLIILYRNHLIFHRNCSSVPRGSPAVCCDFINPGIGYWFEVYFH